jgi:hypothetical protein
MRGVFDSETVDVPCSTCNESIRVRLGSLRGSTSVVCKQGHEVPIDTSQLTRALTGADRAMQRLDRSLANLGS